MTLLDRAELERLQAWEGPCASLFLPTTRAGREVWGDATRLKNELRTASQRLSERGLAADEAEALLAPARALADDRRFWEFSSDGLALYLGRERFHRYRVPLALEPEVVVGERPYLKPLLPLLLDQGRFHVLALSQGHVRLFEGTREALRELDLEDVPRNLVEAVGGEVDPQSLQWHTVTSGGGQRPEANYHGQGGGSDDANVDLRKFLRQVDDGLLRLLRDRDVPLVLAGVESVLAEYRKLAKHPTLVDDEVHGNPDDKGLDELHASAWSAVEPRLHARLDAATERFARQRGTERVQEAAEPILIAAYDGRVAELFVEDHAHTSGRFTPEERRVELGDGPGSEDLLDRAAHETLLRDGVVYAVPRASMPSEAPMAAVLRY